MHCAVGSRRAVDVSPPQESTICRKINCRNLYVSWIKRSLERCHGFDGLKGFTETLMPINERAVAPALHPLNRIMQIDEHDGRIEISTTDIHLPQRIGKALKRAHHSELSVQYGKDEYSVRVRWHR